MEPVNIEIKMGKVGMMTMIDTTGNRHINLSENMIKVIVKELTKNILDTMRVANVKGDIGTIQVVKILQSTPAITNIKEIQRKNINIQVEDIGPGLDLDHHLKKEIVKDTTRKEIIVKGLLEMKKNRPKNQLHKWRNTLENRPS